MQESRFSLVKVYFLFWSPVWFILADCRAEERGWCSAHSILNWCIMKWYLGPRQHINQIICYIYSINTSEGLKPAPCLAEYLLCTSEYLTRWFVQPHRQARTPLEDSCSRKVFFKNWNSYFDGEVLVAVTSAKAFLTMFLPCCICRGKASDSIPAQSRRMKHTCNFDTPELHECFGV